MRDARKGHGTIHENGTNDGGTLDRPMVWRCTKQARTTSGY